MLNFSSNWYLISFPEWRIAIACENELESGARDLACVLLWYDAAAAASLYTLYTLRRIRIHTRSHNETREKKKYRRRVRYPFIVSTNSSYETLEENTLSRGGRDSVVSPCPCKSENNVTKFRVSGAWPILITPFVLYYTHAAPPPSPLKTRRSFQLLLLRSPFLEHRESITFQKIAVDRRSSRLDRATRYPAIIY